MPQSLSQTQTQRAEQQLRLSQQQLQLVRLLEMPIAEFEQRVKKEVLDNPALEEGAPDNHAENGTDDSIGETDLNDTGIDPFGDSEGDHAEDLSKYAEDDLPVYVSGGGREERNELPLGDSGSFIDYLEGQMMNYNLSEDEKKILTY